MQKIILKDKQNHWYPKIIREFEDDQKEKPMFYLSEADWMYNIKNKINKLYPINNFETDRTWTPSVGEKLNKIHFRKKHLHAECDPKIGFCSIHFDKYDPNESITSLIQHLVDSNSGKVILGVALVGILDQIFTDGQLRKSIVRRLPKVKI